MPQMWTYLVTIGAWAQEHHTLVLVVTIGAVLVLGLVQVAQRRHGR